MMWRLMLLVDTDEAGIVHAAKSAKELLRPVFGEVKSQTVQDDLVEVRFKQCVPPLVSRVHAWEPEHRQKPHAGHRRRD